MRRWVPLSCPLSPPLTATEPVSFPLTRPRRIRGQISLARRSLGLCVRQRLLESLRQPRSAHALRHSSLLFLRLQPRRPPRSRLPSHKPSGALRPPSLDGAPRLLSRAPRQPRPLLLRRPSGVLRPLSLGGALRLLSRALRQPHPRRRPALRLASRRPTRAWASPPLRLLPPPHGKTQPPLSPAEEARRQLGRAEPQPTPRPLTRRGPLRVSRMRVGTERVLSA